MISRIKATWDIAIALESFPVEYKLQVYLN